MGVGAKPAAVVGDLHTHLAARDGGGDVNASGAAPVGVLDDICQSLGGGQLNRLDLFPARASLRCEAGERSACWADGIRYGGIGPL